MIEPEVDCALCPRLAEFRAHNRRQEPGWFNKPVPSFGEVTARLAIVGLAPGLRGANRTGRPFTGDFAGDLLYETLHDFGFSKGRYERHRKDGLTLTDCLITNAVRCVPPQNKPTGREIKNCRPFLAGQLDAMPNLKVILALGRIAHESTVSAFGEKRSNRPFGHAARHDLPDGIVLFGSYHCSRYNTNTGRLTTDMFRQVFKTIRSVLQTR